MMVVGTPVLGICMCIQLRADAAAILSARGVLYSVHFSNGVCRYQNTDEQGHYPCVFLVYIIRCANMGDVGNNTIMGK